MKTGYCYYLAAVTACWVLFSVSDGVPIDGTVQNSIEIRVIVDRLAFNEWKEELTSAANSEAIRVEDTKQQMNTYINALFVGLNAVFKELISDGMNLDARIVNIHYVTNETISTDVYDETRVSSSKVLKTFRTWVEKQNFPTTDHVLLLTGWDLSDGQNTQVHGVANVNEMCQGTSSLSAVEVSRNGASVLTLAHELGHSLDLGHDGESNSCSITSGNVMDAGRSGASTKMFKFSQCSRNALKIKLENLQNSETENCLSSANTNAQAVEGRHLGDIFDPDTICKMSVGPDSYFGRSFYGDGGDNQYSDICTFIWCHKSGQNFTTITATDGFPCGSNKRCSLGFCLESSSVPASVSDTCPYGNNPADIIVYDGQTCSQLITAENSRLCYTKGFYRSCCGSCQQSFTGVAGCEFGDRASFCATIDASGCYSNSESCCGTCPKHETSIPGCKYGDRSSQCSSFIQADRSRCSLNAETCCASCFDGTTEAAPTTTTTTAAPVTSAPTTEAAPTTTTTTAAPVTSAPTTEAAPTTTTTTAAPVTSAPTTEAAPTTTTTTAAPVTSAPTTEAAPTTTTTTAAPVTSAPTTEAALTTATTTPAPTTEAATTSVPETTTEDSQCQDLTQACVQQIWFTGRDYLCYADNVRALCCATCRQIKSNYPGIADCEYGDRNLQCPGFIAQRPSRCANNGRVCCATCANY